MVRIGIIGYGYWGPNLVRNFSQLAEARVVFVCDKNASRLESVKQFYPHIQTATDYSQIIKSSDIDAVCVATPLDTHYQIAKEVLLSGKHVLVEKPFASSVKEAEELTEIAQSKNLTLMVDHTFIYTGAISKIKDLIDRGELGKIYYFDSERINLGLLRSDANVIWDLATHDISIINYLFHDQKPISVSATGSSHVLNKKEEMAHITLRHEGGLISHIHVSWLSPVKLRKILVGGDKKMVLYDDVEPVEKIRIYDKGIDINPEQITAFNPLYRGGDIVIPKIDQSEALKKLSEHFVDCIKNKKTPLTNGQQGVEVLRILEAIEKSLDLNGQLINIE